MESQPFLMNFFAAGTSLHHNETAMKLLVIFAFIVGLSGAALAGDPAYSAVKTVRATKGDAILDRLVEMRGARGGPQPDSWVLLFNDAEARGGVREIVVAAGAISSERTPLTGFSGVGDLPVLTLASLSVDSDGAFRIANRAAASTGLGFHWLDYVLRTDATNGQPIWVVELIDYQGAKVGAITVSASTGKVVTPLRVIGTPGDEPVSQAEASPTPWGGMIGQVGGTAKKTSDSVRRGTLRVIGNVEEWLTGQRTVGPED